MKYIPGFTFTPQEVKKSGSVLEQARLNKKIKRNKMFKFGVTYEIHHIIQTDENVKYIFLENSKPVEMVFDNIKDAELRISMAMGDQ